MNLLAIDASTEACSVAISFNGKQYEKFELAPQSHSLLLLPMIDALLAEANCTLADMQGLVFGRGPGSFTGVRIGIGVAQGLAFAANLKVVGVSTLQTMAQQAYDKDGSALVLSAIDARMAEAYVGVYQADEHGLMQPLMEEAVMPPASISDHIAEAVKGHSLAGVGSAWQAYGDTLKALAEPHIDEALQFPRASAMLKLGASMFANGEGVDAEHAQPVYVRDTVTWKKLPGRE
ncbi:tRNA (adenosine(37)-N6)-threonylcarbamoyltransferase complex dimerization subunit type 1 TsaB [Thalassotalea maritima]|uniref:tRNA (adenosine(37)-N6)-threonylcarbamoyltransferase complex dimerization subunit type 1 TsaB n=1 Tax=Thalassotalea maritima TaxID=3242416 RepID=UPI003528D250